MWALIEQLRQLSFAQSMFGNPEPLALIPKHALRLCEYLSYPGVG
jgi:hypothetical protein